MSGKGKPIHFPDRELNEKPSPAEPSKSYEELPQYLDDDYLLSKAERYHRGRGDMYIYEPHPSSLRHGAAATTIRTGGHVSRRRKKNRSASIPCGDPATSSAEKRNAFQKEMHSYDDIDSLQAGQGLGGNNHQGNASIPRSPTSCPSFTTMAKAKKNDRNKSYASTISELTEDGLQGDASDDLSYSDKTASEAKFKRHHVDDSELSKMLSSSSMGGFGSLSSVRLEGKLHPKRTSNVGRKEAKWHAEKRTRARDMKQHALSGSHEFGHDTFPPAGEEDFANKSDLAPPELLPGDSDTFSSLRGKRAERVHKQLHLARTSKRLFLKDLNLTAKELPTNDICSNPLGGELHKLCLAGNHLNRLPDTLVQNLIGLRTLDLQQCKLVSLPDRWDLPNLRRLDLSHNHMKTFFVDSALLGLPKLEHLNISNNEICEIAIPDGCCFLEYLDLSFNDVHHIPDEDLLRLEKLKVLKLSNNHISHVSETICHMPLSELDVTPNPLIQPPTVDCERGIHAMRRYYIGLQRRQKRQRRLRKAEQDVSKTPRIAQGKLECGVNNRVDAVAFHTTVECTSAGSVMPRLGFKKEDRARRRKKKPQSRAGSLVSSEISSEGPNPTNDTLKIIFVGMSCSGKTTMLNRLKYGKLADELAKVPKLEERTIGVNINMWNPKEDCANYGIEQHFDTQVVQEGASSSAQATDIKFSCWDFAGQEVYHATHEIFFSNASLYIVVWDMAAKNKDVQRSLNRTPVDCSPFDWPDSSDEEDDDHFSEQDSRRADRALEHDIDEKVQYWVDCIRSCVPGAVILPVATHDDCFDNMGGAEEAKRRCEKMKERLLDKEKRRIEFLQKRLEKLERGNRANTAAARRLRDLLTSYRRPKLIFGDGSKPDGVLRVSGKFNAGFDELRKKIIHIATGRDKGGTDDRLFSGHVGSTIPPLRMRIRDLIREKRPNFQVVEWDHFLRMLEASPDFSPDDGPGQISDALRFLSSVGEISYFGDCEAIQDHAQYRSSGLFDDTLFDSSDEDPDDGYEPEAIPDDRRDPNSLSSNRYSQSGSSPGSSVVKMSGLSQFIFLNPMWLAATLRCILRHDLKQQLDDILQGKEEETKAMTRWDSIGRGGSFHDAALRCPVITAREARMLWEAKSKIAKSARRATLDTATPKLSAFDFMQRLLVHFGVFVPFDIDIDKVILDGEMYSPLQDGAESRALSMVFFLPSQLNPREGPVDETWTYKTMCATKTCLCQTWLFPDGAPPGLMERLTASVLRTLYDATSCTGATNPSMRSGKSRLDEKGTGQLSFRQILCWKTAFKIVLAKSFVNVDGMMNEAIVEIWAHLEDQGSPFCVASEDTGDGMKRLIISAKGHEGSGGRNIWEGGYDFVVKAADRVMKEYHGLDFIKQGVCPKCLETRSLRHAKVWNWTVVQDAVEASRDLCCENGHDKIDTRYVAGRGRRPKQDFESEQIVSQSFVSYSDLCAGVVLVGLWNGEEGYVCRAGTGFVVDKRYGLIVTAAHNVIDMGGANEPYGSWERIRSRFYGLKKGRVVIGVIPGNCDGQHRGDSLVGPEASFRYFADIAAADINNMDACVLRITCRMENDVGGNGHECSMQPTSPLRDRNDIENEGLQQLNVSTWCELQEHVRLIGYTQGGEGLVPVGSSLNRVLEVVKGDVVKKYRALDLYHGQQVIGHRPRYEIVINCPLTILGQSGCPCVSQAGQVIGILSRADPADKQRCYLVPTREFMELVREARSWED